MPFLQYKCPKCGKKFDELVKSYLDEVLCPDCKETAVRDYSGEMYSSTGKQTKKCTGNCKTCGGFK
jgi:putative FmdB family regulatory protein